MNGMRCLCTLIALLLCSEQLSAKGSNYRTEDRYNPQHIGNLPPEVRNAIVRRCSDPKALHPFANYADHSKKIVLHFEHFVCGGDGTYCNPSGCLHQVWVLVHGHYWLARSYYSRAGD